LHVEDFFHARAKLQVRDDRSGPQIAGACAGVLTPELLFSGLQRRAVAE
jgi:hypothetical protein